MTDDIGIFEQLLRDRVETHRDNIRAAEPGTAFAVIIDFARYVEASEILAAFKRLFTSQPE